MEGASTIPAGRSRYTANRGFTWVVGISLLIHGSALGGVMAAQKLRQRPREVINAMPVQLVRLGKRRDPKLLPRKLALPPPPASEGVTLDTSKSSKSKAKAPPKKDRPRKLSDAARRLLERAPPSDLDSAMNKLDDEPEGDPEGDPLGTTTDPTNAARGYAAAVTRVLQANYNLPETIPASVRPFLKARVILYVERDGTIARYEFTEAHPNKLFMGALEKLLRTHKLPPPPAGQAGHYRSTGIEVIFRPG